jgi:GH25 family lysozyme M1 (1,4-beta-N-acetylmuramidase)
MVSKLVGLDVSHHQEEIDWEKVARSGRAFAFIKASEGAKTPDNLFDTNRSGAATNGVLTGAYHFFHPTVDVQAQVDLFVGKVGKLVPGDLPPVLDLEVPEEWAEIAQRDRIVRVTQWLTQVEQLLGVRPIIYASPSIVRSFFESSSELLNYRLWLANYNLQPTVPAPWVDWTFWQYTDTGVADGVIKNVDLDLFNGDLERLRSLAVKPPASVLIAEKSSDVRIETGNGDDPVAALYLAHRACTNALEHGGLETRQNRVLMSALRHLERAMAAVTPVRRSRRHPSKRTAKNDSRRNRQESGRTANRHRSRNRVIQKERRK